MAEESREPLHPYERMAYWLDRVAKSLDLANTSWNFDMEAGRHQAFVSNGQKVRLCVATIRSFLPFTKQSVIDAAMASEPGHAIYCFSSDPDTIARLMAWDLQNVAVPHVA